MAVAGIGTAIGTGIANKRALDRGQEESKEMYLGELAEGRATRRAQERLKKSELKEYRRQFDLSYGLKQEELGMKRQEMASNAFHDQVSRLQNILGKNEQLKNVYMNRLRGLRRAA